MHYVLFCTDKTGASQIRADNRPAHVEYLKANSDILYVAGPTLTEDGSGMNGSLIVIDVEDRKAAETFASNDPYARAGLFESVVIKPWKLVFGPDKKD